MPTTTTKKSNAKTTSGKAGAKNAALLAAAILSLSDAALAKKLDTFRARQTAAIGKRPKD